MCLLVWLHAQLHFATLCWSTRTKFEFRTRMNLLVCTRNETTRKRMFKFWFLCFSIGLRTSMCILRSKQKPTIHEFFHSHSLPSYACCMEHVRIAVMGWFSLRARPTKQMICWHQIEARHGFSNRAGFAGINQEWLPNTKAIFGQNSSLFGTQRYQPMKRPPTKRWEDDINVYL